MDSLSLFNYILKNLFILTNVHILDGNSEHDAHAWRKISIFAKIRFVTFFLFYSSLDLIECIKQIK